MLPINKGLKEKLGSMKMMIKNRIKLCYLENIIRKSLGNYLLFPNLSKMVL